MEIDTPTSPLIDKQLVAQRFARARATYGREALVQRQVAEKMVHLLTRSLLATGVEAVRLPHHFHHIVELGCGPGCLSRLLCQTFRPETLLLNDLCPEMGELVQDLCASVRAQAGGGQHETGGGTCPPAVSFQSGDAEALVFPADTDLIISCSTLQWFARPAEFFHRCYLALPPGGMLALSTFGPDNLRETKALTGGGLTYLPLGQLQAMLAQDFQLIHSEEERITLSFATPLDVLRHLKLTGATGTDRRAWTRARLDRFCADYVRQFQDADRQVSLTYHPIYLIAKKLR